MYCYNVFEEKLFNTDLGVYISYGINVEESTNTVENPKFILSLSDVSVTKEIAENIAKLCNKIQLSPIHLRDVVYDTIE